MITHDVKLCIGGDNSKMRLVVKCHDTGVNLRVYLVTCRHSKWREINEPYYIPAGSTAVLKIAKPDNTFVLADGLIESDDILFELPPQAFTVAGVSEAEVSLFGADGRKVTSDTFNIDVSEECVCDGHEESETYVDIMAKQIGSAVEAEKNAKQSAEDAEKAAKRAEEAATRAENAIASGGGGGVSVSVDGKTLVMEDGVLRVNTTNNVEKDNAQPITSAAVYATVGNIGAILDTI